MGATIPPCRRRCQAGRTVDCGVMRQLTAYVPDDHAAKIEAHAKANDRSVAAELRRMTRLYCAMLDRQAAGEAPPAGEPQIPAPA